jgi:hypothetical protein
MELRGISAEQAALFLASGIGGPACISFYTPLRNAVVLGARDPLSNPVALYRKVFETGIRGGYMGAGWATVFSAPQFLALGPIYHLATEQAGPTAGMFCAAITETVITYGAQTRNAQLAYNLTVEPAKQIPLQNPLNFVGAGAPAHIIRNLTAMSGIRVLNGPCSSLVEGTTAALNVDMKPETTKVVSDFMGSILAAAVSMPFNQLFNFLVTAQPGEASAAACARFLQDQYFQRGENGRLKLRRTMMRDVSMRCAYVAPVLSSYSFIESTCVDWVKKGKHDWLMAKLTE